MLIALVLYLASIPVLWVLYLAIMNLAAAAKAEKITPAAYRLAYVVLCVGYLVDFLVNVFVCTPLFLEPPRELLVTGRVSRLKYTGTGWRQRLAEWFCTNLLDPFDPSGCHCKK